MSIGLNLKVTMLKVNSIVVITRTTTSCRYDVLRSRKGWLMQIAGGPSYNSYGCSRSPFLPVSLPKASGIGTA